MTSFSRLFVIVGSAACAWTAAPALAATYALNFGPTLIGQITTSDTLTGGGYAITGMTGTFMGEAITGVVANPFSPNEAHYVLSSGLITDVAPPGVNCYTYDDLLTPDGAFDEDGLLFTTATTIADVYLYEGTFSVDYTPRGKDVDFTTMDLEGSIVRRAAVPEPATWAMFLMGAGAMGIALRRRRRVNVSYSLAG